MPTIMVSEPAHYLLRRIKADTGEPIKDIVATAISHTYRKVKGKYVNGAKQPDSLAGQREAKGAENQQA